MKSMNLVFVAALFSTSAQAGETLGADAIAKMITGNTVHAARENGDTRKNYFAPDGKLYRQEGGKITEGAWRISDDGMHCVEGMPGGCARIVRNDDGTHDRVLPNGKVLLKWTAVVNGKDF